MVQSLNSNIKLGLGVLLCVILVVSTGTGVALEQKSKPGVEIIATPKSGKGPMWVHLEPRIINIKAAKFEWSFGDGTESGQKIPSAHYYEFGRYNVSLEVIDIAGKKYSAAITIDATSPGG